MIAQPTERQYPPIPEGAKSEILALSVTASALCESIAGGEPWTFETLAIAAEALERRISAKWYVRTKAARL